MQKYRVCLIASLSILTVTWSSYAYVNNKQFLLDIHRSISKQEKKLVDQRQTYRTLMLELRQQETAITTLLSSMQQTTMNIQTLNNGIVALNKQIGALTEERYQQQQRLAYQLESAFKLGSRSGLGFIFNKELNERNKRVIAYFGYLNREREQTISQLKTTQDKLTAAQLVLEHRLSVQQRLQLEQQKERLSLKQRRDKRWQTIIKLNQLISQGQEALDRLYENESKLQRRLDQATKRSKVIADKEMRAVNQIRSRQKMSNYKPTLAEKALMLRVGGIGKPQNRLNWPIEGKIVHYFGEPIQDQLFWKGLVIASQEGQTIRAVASGRVILADWLQGYGFMIAIDHGQGDMSLYGYNQRLLVNVTQNVKKGQSIALTGNSGGQNRSGLYFEIRRDGQALNPRAWLK